MRRLLLCGLLAMTACEAPDWRAQQIARAVEKIRSEVGEPSAQFSKLQLTGDQNTGQTCGVVQEAHNAPARFIVYIDGTAGPYIEGGGGAEYLNQDRFDFVWQNDCVAEGYDQ
ncbi:MAG TPA: hypothetical protein VF474_13505 [Phenylobacterium sp.]